MTARGVQTAGFDAALPTQFLPTASPLQHGNISVGYHQRIPAIDEYGRLASAGSFSNDWFIADGKTL